MRQGDLIKLTISGFGTSGEGVGKVGDTFVYAKNAIEGEKVSARVAYCKKKVAFADVKQILEESKYRQSPKCQKFLKCGGCQIQHLTYEKQLEFKRNQVAAALKNIGGITFDLPKVVASPSQWRYRNKTQLPIGSIGQKAVVGLFQDGSHKIVSVEDCPLTGEWTKPLISAILAYIKNSGALPYDEKSHSGLLRHVVARFLDGQILVTMVANGQKLPKVEILEKLLSKSFSQWGLFVNENTDNTNVILGKNTRWIAGLKEIKSNALGVDFSLRPDSFFQVNFEVMQLLYAQVKSLLLQCKTEVLIDCFSGAGVLSAFLYDSKIKEYAIEIVNAAHLDAEDVKKRNKLDNLTNICGDVSQELPKIFEKHKNQIKTIVLDPPRKGISASTAQLLKQVCPENIVYISCDPATLSRDLKLLLSDDGYSIQYAQCFDMFPQTKHIETLVLLERKNHNI